MNENHQPASDHNPYDFILNPAATPKKSLVPKGNSKIQRIALVVGGGVVLLMIVFLVVGLLSSAGSAQKQDWLSLLQQQTELIRISDIGIQKAHGTEAKNLATTAKLSLESSKLSLQNLADKAGADVSEKKLASGRDAQVDSTLTQAEQTNQFDATFTATIQRSLKGYQQTLKKLYDASGNEKTKTELEVAYQNATLLIEGQSKAGGA